MNSSKVQGHYSKVKGHMILHTMEPIGMFFLNFLFIFFFTKQQVKVLHEANIQEKSNIDILINRVKKKFTDKN